MAKVGPLLLVWLALWCAKLACASYLVQSQAALEPQPPVITPFAFNQNVQENQRSSVLCTISSGDLPVAISWLKDGQLLTPSIAQAKRIIIKPDSDQSTLKFASVRLDQAGNYTCVAKNRAGIQAHSAPLVVHGEPRWLREPQHEPIVALRGQTIVIDCQTTGWPKPQQSWQIKSKFPHLRRPSSGRKSLAGPLGRRRRRRRSLRCQVACLGHRLPLALPLQPSAQRANGGAGANKLSQRPTSVPRARLASPPAGRRCRRTGACNQLPGHANTTHEPPSGLTTGQLASQPTNQPTDRPT